VADAPLPTNTNDAAGKPMKEISGCASGTVRASARQCFEALIAVDAYPDWIGEYVREVHVLERDSRGHPTRARAIVHVAQSVFGKDFELELAISTEVPRAICITRIPEHEDDAEHLALVWHIERGSAATVTLEFAARISLLPGWLPIGDAGDLMAAAALEAAADALDDSSAPARQRA
jgi:ribosome-associated toxin RatA of RatAB toxin-antitoxin module